ncbi:AMP-binding protein [Kyrpidia sp.]|uniref:AMP-binding protein n=1 Tax=Kyrpidia sp. TaxID=2073077 RepID=UPI00258D250A|nr:AMP-binding protein [Kyrpidia sp.]MCL6574946.1 AMP-binding protein [Kyrpidia sp.]
MKERSWHRHWPKGLPWSLSYPDVSVGAIFKGSARRFGQKAALVYRSQVYSFSELYRDSLRFASALNRMGLGKGDVIAIHLFNMPQYVIAYYGILLSGAVFTPISPLLPVDDVAFQLRDSEASALITHERLAGVARQAVEGTGVKRVFVTGDEEMGPPFRPIDTGSLGDGWLSLGKVLCQESPMEPDVPFRPEEDLAHLAYTGGTTGRPKGVMLTHRHVVANTVQYAAWGTGCLPRVEDGGLVLEPVDPALIGENAEYRTALGEAILVNITPWFHAMGTIGYLNHPILTGTTIVLHSRFDPRTYLEDARRYQATTLGGAPAVFHALLRQIDSGNEVFPSVRHISSGAAPLPVETIARLQQHFPEAVVVEAYGMTEVTMGATSNPSGRSGLRKPGSVGIPVFDTDCKIAPVGRGEGSLPAGEIGEVCIRGPQVMKGYYRKPEETAEVLRNGWMHTGDLGRLDEDGYLYIVDRIKDMILYKGYNVYPRELEELLHSHPAVAQAAVVGKPDREAGEIPKAYVVRRPNSGVSPEELMGFVNASVAPYKRLREIVFVGQLPVSGAGKVLKRVLREQEEQGGHI